MTSKIIEKVIANRQKAVTTLASVHGFLPQEGTTTALRRVMGGDLNNITNEGGYSLLVTYDISAASDSANHSSVVRAVV